MLAVIVAILAPAPSPAAAAGSRTEPPETGFGVRWLDLPEGGETASPTSGLRAHVAPGTSLTRLVEVRNVGTQPLAAGAEVVAAEVSGTEFTLLEGFASDLTGWSVVEPAAPFEVPGGGRQVLRLRIEVPEDAPLGEHLGAVLVSGAPTQRGPVGLTSRLGLSVFLSVGEGAAPALNFSVLEITPRLDGDGRPVIDALVENTGGRSLSVSASAELRDGPGGLRVDPVEAERPVALRPGEQGELTFAYARGLPAGPWLARVEAKAGLLERAAEATVTFPERAGDESPAVPADEVPMHRDRGLVIPFAVALLVAVAALLVWAWQRRKVQPAAGGR